MEDKFEQKLREKLKDKSHEELVDIIVKLEKSDCELKAEIENQLSSIKLTMIKQTFNVKY